MGLDSIDLFDSQASIDSYEKDYYQIQLLLFTYDADQVFVA
jgi:hypothetical protein